MSKSSFIGYGFIKSIPEGWFLESFEVNQKVAMYLEDLPGPVKTFRIAPLHDLEQIWYIPQECIEREDYWFNIGFTDGYNHGQEKIPEGLNSRQISDYLEGYQAGVTEYCIEQEEDDSHRY